MSEKTGADARREEIQKQYWPKEDLWTGDKEVGWFPALRTLPLILILLREKKISQNKDPSLVYFELLSRHRSGGIIEMGHEADHAFASGFESSRAVRSWQERMSILEENGFIKTKKVGNQRFKYVAIIHPTTAIQRLYERGKVAESWWDAYLARKRETKEATYEKRREKKEGAQKSRSKPIF